MECVALPCKGFGMNDIIRHPSVQTIREYLASQYHLPSEQIESMLPIFLDTLVDHMDRLEKALSEKDPLFAGKAAHTIKGAFLNLGLDECAELSRNIEEAGKSGESIQLLAPQVKKLREKLTVILN